MENLVFVAPNHLKSIPFTTSDVIAKYAQVKHHSIQQIISKHLKDLEEFGQVAFEMRAVKYSRGTNQLKIYHLNEEQATLLITYLKNTVPVRLFKKNLVRQFYQMRSELMKRRIYREELKPVRRELTDVIQENPNHGKWDFKLYTDLAYKLVTGKNAAQIRKDRGANKKAIAIEYMTADEIFQISKLQNQITVLLEMGMDYHQIKSLMIDRLLVGKIA